MMWSIEVTTGSSEPSCRIKDYENAEVQCVTLKRWSFNNQRMNNPNFQDLHHTFRPRILRYMRRLVGEEEAEDLTQEVFLKVSQSLSDFKGKSRLSTWIYRIAANAAVDRLRMPSYKRVVREHPAKTRLVEIEGDCDRA